MITLSEIKQAALKDAESITIGWDIMDNNPEASKYFEESSAQVIERIPVLEELYTLSLESSDPKRVTQKWLAHELSAAYQLEDVLNRYYTIKNII